MYGILEINELVPILSRRARMRWRLAYIAVSAIRFLLSEGRGPDYPVGLSILSRRAHMRWRLAYIAFSAIRALLSEARGIISEKFLRSPSFTALIVGPEYPAGINQPDLKRLVEEKDLGKLQQLGGIQAVLSELESDAENGIQGDVEDIARRQISFGYNFSNQKQSPAKMFHLWTGVFLEAFKDPIILILLVCAVLSLVYGINKHGWEGGSNGGSILAAIAGVIAVSVFNNFWVKEQFNMLRKNSSKQWVRTQSKSNQNNRIQEQIKAEN